jgi:hypothetical protein
MAVVQVVMEMSKEAALGIAAGTMVRHGGVVYNATGGIVEHLADAVIKNTTKEAVAPAAKASTSVFSSVAKHLKDPKVLIAIGLGAVLVGGVIYYVRDKSKKNNKQESISEIPKCVVDYNDSVLAYLDAISIGSVSLDKIDCVIKSVNALRENKEVTIDFAKDKSETLINYIFDYTAKLAEANSFELVDFEKMPSTTAENTLTYLHRYLQIQKEIFEKAA